MANINLSIQKEISNNFQNQNIKDLENTNKSNTPFKDTLERFKNLSKDTNLDKENEEDSLINYEVLQGILSKLETTNLEEIIKSNDKSINFSDEEFKLLNKLFDLLNKTKLNNNFFIDNKDMKNEYEDFDFINETLKNLNENLEKQNDGLISKLDYENIKLNISDELYKIESYNKLEVISSHSKENILEKNKILAFNDKEINTLNNILDSDNENLLIQNNNINTFNLDNIEGNNVNEAKESTIRTEFINEDVIKTIKYLKSNNMEEINIKITPKELGEMNIKLIKNSEETKILITINKEDIFDLVNKNTQDILKHLNDLDMKVKEVSVDIKSNNEKFFSDNLNQEFNRKNHENKNKKSKPISDKDEEIEDIKVKNLYSENINILI